MWENSKDGMRLSDRNGIVIMVNNAYCQMVGKNRNELENKPLSEVYHPLNKNIIINHYLKRVKNGTVIPYGESELKLWNGKEIWFGVTNSFLRINNNSLYILSAFRDISERKHAESQLKMLAHAIKSIRESVIIADINANIKFVNKAFLRTYGFEEKEVMEHNASKILLSKTPTSLIEEISRKTKEGGWQGELLNTKKDGTTFPVSLSTSLVADEKGHHIAYMGVATDITSLKEVEEKNNITMSLLHATLESTADGILVINREGTVTGYNQRFIKMWQIPVPVMKSMNDKELLKYVVDQLKEPVKFLATIEELYKKPRQESIDTIELKGGRVFRRYSIPQKLGDKIVGRVWSFSDITEPVQSLKIRDALFKISEAVFTTTDIQTHYQKIHEVVKSLMPADNFFIALYDEKTNLVNFPYFVNEKDTSPHSKTLSKGLTEYVITKGESLLITKEEGLNLYEKGEIESPNEPTAVWLGIALKHNGKTIGVMAVQDYENKNTYGETEKQILTFVSKQVALAIDRKRTSDELLKYTEQLKLNKKLLEKRADELVKLNENLERSEKKLIEINSAKDKFFSIIAHDLRSPFQPLLGLSEIIANERNSLTEEEIDHLTYELNQVIKQQYSLLENLLNWATMQTGKMKFELIKINLFSSVENSINILNIYARKKNISVKNQVPTGFYVKADKNSLNSIFQNLLYNAIKFTNPDGKVLVSAFKKSCQVEIEIADDGVGMDEGTLLNIFQIGSHFSTKGTANERGTGLGLALCKELIEKHGGTIQIESKRGEGTKIRFTLPLITN